VCAAGFGGPFRLALDIFLFLSYLPGLTMPQK
jgi:hypothetical protein